MEYKVFCTLFITLMLGFGVLSQETCEVEPKLRINCGWPGVTEQECKAKNCCFDNTVRGTPWCFSPQVIETEEECIF
ncbi:trefoil factor 1 [Dromiciops gliroides]|uniref:trefoil factor 1 n=1 Tax=Dromiciops gliroides TaxID=33562 RepID=UPI001CC7BA8F|nr:trefoil factor 1 [Dromiciops gliroides]